MAKISYLGDKKVSKKVERDFIENGRNRLGFSRNGQASKENFFRNIILTLKMTVEKSIFSKISTFR